MASTIRDLQNNPPTDAKERRELCNAARDLYMSLETPVETMHRLFWSVVQLPVVQVGIDMKLFRTLSESPDRSWTTEALSESLSVDHTLLYRLLRYLSAFGLVSQPKSDTYVANAATHWLATPGAEGGTKHYRVLVGQIMASLPEFLAKTGYQNPKESTNCAFNLAMGTDKPAYAWRPADMSIISAFTEFMKSQRAGQRDWMDAFPKESLELADADESRAVFVDVGGSVGHQCMALRQKLPNMKGRVIVQDQDYIIDKLDRAPLSKLSVEAEAHDFFTPQPVKGAKAYYMRNIMHDWPDDECVRILAQLKAVMASDSMILIDEMVLPDSGASWKQVQKDIQMMAALGAMERSEGQWKALLERVGLRIDAIHVYDDGMGDSIIVAVPA